MHLHLASTISGEFFPIMEGACVQFTHQVKGVREATLSNDEVLVLLSRKPDTPGAGAGVRVLFYDESRPTIDAEVSDEAVADLLPYSDPGGTSPLTR